MNRNILFRLLLVAVSVAAYMVSAAQNLDPTVVVDRNYEGKLMEVHKPSMKMQVPDSVTRFDLDFDYSVFDNPYKGSYEFSPYTVKMHPASSKPAPKRFYLRAGAGYPLHPELDMVWSPVSGKRFRMDVYGVHRSFLGQYRSFKPSAAADPVPLGQWVNGNGNRSYWNGNDFKTRAGVCFCYDWKKGTSSLDVSYYGLASRDTLRRRGYNALDISAVVSSVPCDGEHFIYDVSASYRFGNDNAGYFSEALTRQLDEHVFVAGASLGWAFEGGHRMMFDFGLDMAAYRREINVNAGNFHIVPHYVFSKGRWDLDLGLRLSRSVSHDTATVTKSFASPDQIIYPDVTVRFSAIPDAMSVYARATGGSMLNSYTSVLEANRHVDMTYGRGKWALMDNTVERVSVSAGIEGRIGAKFSYRLCAGYVNYGNAMLDAVAEVIAPVDSVPAYLPGIGYASYSRFVADAVFCWKTESIRLDGNVRYGHSWGLGTAYGVFAPADFSGDVAFGYNWNRRIFAGLDCQFSTARRGSVLTSAGGGKSAVIPGYADLGVSLEVPVSRHFSLWVRGGNLLNMTVQRNPLYAEQGISCTLGICLDL